MLFPPHPPLQICKGCKSSLPPFGLVLTSFSPRKPHHHLFFPFSFSPPRLPSWPPRLVFPPHKTPPFFFELHKNKTPPLFFELHKKRLTLHQASVCIYRAHLTYFRFTQLLIEDNVCTFHCNNACVLLAHCAKPKFIPPL